MSNKLDYDYAKFESNMEKEISHRKMLGNLSSSQRYSELGIMDQFFLFGIPPNKEKNPVPTVIAAFPPFRQSTIPVENVLSLSMPNWDFSNPNSKTKLSNIFSSSCDNGIIDEFVFQFNAGETKMFGICSHIQPSKATRNASLPFFATDSTKKGIFCMCLISKLPIFNTHFTFLNYLASLSTGTVLNFSKSDDSIENTFVNKYESDYRVEHEMQNDTLIEGLELTGAFGQVLGITIPDEFQSKVFDYYSKTMYSSSYKLGPGYSIRFPPPTTPEQRLISWASLDTLFSVLNVRDIVELLAALILDAQVLIVGSSMQEVSMTVYGLYALLTPFKYCGVVMPIIPNNEHYLDLLSSPTPFIFGMPNIPKLKKMSFLESTYIVNVDKHKMGPVNYFPKYPSFNSVVKKICEVVASRDNTAFRPEDELMELSRGTIRERSRSAIIQINPISGARQIRVKPNFSPSIRRNNNTVARVSFNQPETSETVDNSNTPEKAPKLEPFKTIENNSTPEKAPKLEPFKTVDNSCTPEKAPKLELFKTVDNSNSLEKVPKLEPFKTLESNITSDKNLSPCLSEKESDERNEKTANHKKVEINQKVESIGQIPNFSAIQSGLAKRRYTFTPNQFQAEKMPSIQQPPPAQISLSNSCDASSQQLSDFPVFQKPVVANELANDSNPYKFPTDLTKKLGHKVTLSKDSIDKILEAIHEPLDFIFTDLLNCYFVTNSLENITIFNQTLFLASVKQEDLQFYEFLLESQTFQDYVETKLNEFTNSKSKETGQRRLSTFGPKTKRRVSTVKKLFDS